jgi:hypothetical protein
VNAGLETSALPSFAQMPLNLTHRNSHADTRITECLPSRADALRCHHDIAAADTLSDPIVGGIWSLGDQTRLINGLSSRCIQLLDTI